MKKCILALLTVLACAVLANAQRTVTGTVTDPTGEPLIGATVLVKGTATGTVTDTDGSFSLSVPAGDNQVLVVSYTGYSTQEMTVGVSNVMNVTLDESSEILDEVVVTALGFETKRSKVGTASSTVEGESLSRSGEVGLLNALAGKSAGLQVISSSGEPGAGSTIRIRGATSITGDVQPLIVLDGIPIFNESYYGQAFGGETTASSGSLGSGGGTTQQSRLNDLNPEDIESVEVLRGASAAAVWGSRAANGVLVIKTKQGRFRPQKEWTVSLNSSVAFDQLNKEVELQHEYGGGTGGIFRFAPPGGVSWGDKISARPGGEDDFNTEGEPGYTGKFVSDITGKTYYSIANGSTTNVHGGKNSTELHDLYDYLFQTATTLSNSLSLSNAGQNGSVYFSMANLQQDGIIAGNSDYNRTTARLNATRHLGKFAIEGNMGYTYSTSKRVQMGSNLNGLFLGGLREPVDFNARDYEGTFISPAGVAFIDRHRAYRNPLGANQDAIYNNPVWTTNRVDNDNVVNRFMGKGELRYEPTNWLNLTARAGVDQYTDERSDFFPFLSAGENNGGRYSKETITRRQLSFDFIGRARFDLTTDIALSALAGIGLNQSKQDDIGATTRGFINPLSAPQLPNGLTIPFNISAHERTAGVYGSLGFELYDQLFLNVSARQDWLSTLPDDDNTVFYPAADLSWQFSKMLKSTGTFSSGRLRLGYGQVGRGPDPYLTRQVFFQPNAGNTGWGEGWGPGLDVLAYGGGAALSTVAANPDIKPEIKTEMEAGIDLGFFKDRIGLRFTGYRNKTEDLIIQVTVPESTGYTHQITNAAEIENKGFELEWDFVPVRQQGGLEWNIYGNFTRNRNKVVSMAGTNNITLSGFSGTTSSAIVGEQLGVIFGSHLDKDANGNYILDEDGFPTLAATSDVIADPNPDYRMGLGSGLRYKGLSVNLLFETSQGNEMWNGTRGALIFFGRAKETSVETNLSEEQANTMLLYNGNTVAAQYPHLQNDDGSFTVRGKIEDFGGGEVFLDENWWRFGLGNSFTGPDDSTVEDASWIRLRELTVSYTLGKNLLKVNWLENATISFTGRNLLLWTDYTGNDPDTNLTGSALNGLGIDYFQNPSSRTYKLGLNLTF